MELLVLICEKCGSEMIDIPNTIKEMHQILNSMSSVISYDVTDMNDIIGYKCEECGWRFDV